MTEDENIQKQLNEQQGTPESNELTDEQKALLSLKDNSVSKEEYNALNEKYKGLLQAVVDGGKLPDDVQKQDEPKIEDLRKKLAAEGLSNLEYAQAALNLRKAIIERDGANADPFVPHGVKVSASQEDFEKAQKVADIFQECIDESRGDSNVFTALLMNRTKDVSIPLSKGRRA